MYAYAHIPEFAFTLYYKIWKKYTAYVIYIWPGTLASLAEVRVYTNVNTCYDVCCQHNHCTCCCYVSSL